MWLRGKLSAKMKTSINDPRLLDLTREQAEITLAFFREEEYEYRNTLEEILGVIWTKEQVAGLSGGEDSTDNIKVTKVDKLRYPLALILKPDLMKELKTRFGYSDEGTSKLDHVPKGTTSLGMTSKDEFIKKMGFKSSVETDGYFIEPKTRAELESGFKPRNNPVRLGK
jgi:hypothetical protein